MKLVKVRLILYSISFENSRCNHSLTRNHGEKYIVAIDTLVVIQVDVAYGGHDEGPHV